MADRAKRRIKEPRRFDPDEVEDATKKARRKVKVFRKLKRRDVTSELLEQTVHIVWPDNGAWYGATVKQLKVRQLWAEVEYTCTGEVEQLDLGELIGDGQIAVVEEHPPGYECGKDELPFEGTLKDVDVIAAEEGDGAEKDKSPDYGDEEGEDEEPEEESSDSDGSMEDLEEAVARRKGKRRRGNPDAIARLAKRAKPAGYDDEDLPAKHEDDEETEYGAAEEKSQQFLASVMAKKPQQPGAHAADSFYSGGQAATKPKLVKQRPPPPPISQTKSFRPQGSSDELLRGKVREQLQGPLATAAKELASEDGVEESEHPSPAGVATAVEAAMYKLFGGINNQYKSKARALLFNLRDANNPQLRQRVLTGDIQPDALVQMTSEELASKELSQWRKQREQEALKASVLDEEAAAKFSTAAALAQKEKEKQASKQRAEAATPAAEAPLGARDEATKISSSAAPEARPSRTQAEPASPVKAAEPATSSLRTSSATEAADSLRAGSAEAKAAHVPTDWASIKAQAAAAKEAAAPHIEDFEAFAGRQPGDDAWHPGSPLSGDEHASPASPSYPAYEAPAEELHDEGRLGDQVWEGPVRGLDAVGTFGAAAYAIHGNADWGELLANPELTVKGLVRLEKLSPFFEELRSASRHRTLSLVLLRAPPASSPSASSLLGKAAGMFVKKRRAGVAEPAPELEAYFLPPGNLGDHMLRAAREDAPAGTPVPRHLGDDEMLLAIVHPKGWKLPPMREQQSQPAAAPEPAPAAAAAAVTPPHSSAAPAASAPEVAAAAVPPPPPPSPPPVADQTVQPEAKGSIASPAAAAADPRRAVHDPRRAAAPAGPGVASVAAAADPRASPLASVAAAPVAALALSAAPPSPPASTPPVSAPASSGASGMSLADILQSVQAASSGAPAATGGIGASAAAPQPAAPQGSQAQPAASGSAAAPALPAGLDLSCLSELAAALGFGTSTAAAQQQQPPAAAPRPGPDAARDPRRDPRMAAAAAASGPLPVRPGPPGPAPMYRAAPGGPGSPPPQYQPRPGPPLPAPITLPPPQPLPGPPPPRLGPRPMHRAPMGGRHGGDPLQQMQPPPRGSPGGYGGRGRGGGGGYPGRGRGGRGGGGWRDSQM